MKGNASDPRGAPSTARPPRSPVPAALRSGHAAALRSSACPPVPTRRSMRRRAVSPRFPAPPSPPFPHRCSLQQLGAALTAAPGQSRSPPEPSADCPPLLRGRGCRGRRAGSGRSPRRRSLRRARRAGGRGGAHTPIYRSYFVLPEANGAGPKRGGRNGPLVQQSGPRYRELEAACQPSVVLPDERGAGAARIAEAARGRGEQRGSERVQSVEWKMKGVEFVPSVTCVDAVKRFRKFEKLRLGAWTEILFTTQMTAVMERLRPGLCSLCPIQTFPGGCNQTSNQPMSF
ncbi:atherin-like [Centrocercus urophasianus]|uniref:atherin-like n=1 Tax=Centrocercus urophasianus TaxID=9002 RepID=UPI001C648DBF|nr:atherin-like [Centrocercus urophasianus]